MAFGRFLLAQRGLLGQSDPEAREHLAAVSRMIEDSPALRAREQQIFAAYTDSLAALIRDEQGAAPQDIEPWIVANALIGVHRALVGYARRRVVAGARQPRLARDVRAQATRALALLEQGLGEYGRGQPGSPSK